MVKRRLLGVVKSGLSYLPALFVDHSSFYTSTVSTNGVSCSFGEPKFFQHLAKVGINLSGLKFYSRCCHSLLILLRFLSCSILPDINEQSLVIRSAGIMSGKHKCISICPCCYISIPVSSYKKKFLMASVCVP